MTKRKPPATTAIVVHKPAQVPAARLEEQARDFIDGSISESTKRAYRSDWRTFEAWCKAHRLSSPPAMPATLVLFLTHLAEEKRRKVSTIMRARAAISVAHDAAGADNPSDAAVVKRAMSGIRRKLGSAPTKKRPLLADEMVAIVKSIGTDTLVELRDRALLAIGFSGAFRRAELVAINVEHVKFTKQGASVLIAKSKTDQEGKGRHIGIPRAPADADVCPVELLEEWIAKAKLKNGPVFRALKHGLVGGGLHGDAVADIIKARAQTALELSDEEVEGLAGHSLRRGFITVAIRAGKNERDIMRQTGHRSTAVFRSYIEEASVFMDNAADGIWK